MDKRAHLSAQLKIKKIKKEKKKKRKGNRLEIQDPS
jgi:hypothetical protein